MSDDTVPTRGKIDFVSYVQQQITRMEEYVQLGRQGEVTFLELNSALCNYQHVYLTLISMYNLAKIDYEIAKEEWDSWYAEVFVSVRARENRQDIAAQKWLSQKELDMLVRHEYRAEFSLKHVDLLELERKMAFLSRLLEAWQSQQYILGTLSKNLQSEISSAGMGTN